MSIRKNPFSQYVTPVDLSGFDLNPKSWMEEKNNLPEPTWILGYAFDGVIWGKFHNSKLILAHDVFPDASPPLRLETLQHAYLFSKSRMIHIFRTDSGFQAVKIADAPENTDNFFSENHILWGTRIVDARNGFTLVTEGRHGMRHAFPMELTADEANWINHPLRLSVLNYIAYDAMGQAYVGLSRLVDIKCIRKGGVK